MMQKHLGLLILCVAAGWSWIGVQHAGASDRPNILFLFADDQSYDTLSAYGNTEVQTPNLDALAKRSLVFERAYNMGSWSGAVCVASRTMLNSGKFVWRAHAHAGGKRQPAPGGDAFRPWSVLMREAGYRTYFTGKWHVRWNAKEIFDEVDSIRPGMPNQTAAGYNRPKADGSDPWDPTDPKFGGFWKGGKHWSEVTADEAVAYLSRDQRDDKPFFMYVAFNAPHDPRQSPQEYVDMYPVKDVKIPQPFLEEYPYANAICGKGLRDETLAPYPRTKHAIAVHRREYHAIISHMDAQVGRILKALEATGEADNTYIFFTADHGLACGHHGLMGKQNMYEHSLRVPLLAAGPGIAAGRAQAAVYLQDIMAESLKIAGAERPDYVEFAGLSNDDGYRLEPEDTAYPAVYGAYLARQRAVIYDGWKLMVYPTADYKVRLYHVAEDPLETNDLADDPKYAAKKQELIARLLKLQSEMDDTLDLSSVGG
jgi:arylsulfatase A-like enzyme